MLIVAVCHTVGTNYCCALQRYRKLSELKRYTLSLWESSGRFAVPEHLTFPAITEPLAPIAAPVNLLRAAPRAEWPCVTRAIRQLQADASPPDPLTTACRCLRVIRARGGQCWTR